MPVVELVTGDLLDQDVEAIVNAWLRVATEQGFSSVAMPLIGAGTGGGDDETVQRMIEEEVHASDYAGRVVIVRYGR
jgi:O-acetyl-ADP-ribose deacetylase (regulator of RNase III)